MWKGFFKKKTSRPKSIILDVLDYIENYPFWKILFFLSFSYYFTTVLFCVAKVVSSCVFVYFVQY